MPVWQAIAVGLVWVNVPAVALVGGVPAAGLLVFRASGEAVNMRGASVVWLVAGLIALGFVLGWVWWSVMVPRWRLWAYERVGDIAELKRWAVAAGITWPDGWTSSGRRSSRERMLHVNGHLTGARIERGRTVVDVLIQLVPALIWTVLLGVPLYFILGRAGLSRWWLAIAIVPMIGAVVVLWIVAFARWPAAAAMSDAER
jgi:hypothetical protein